MLGATTLACSLGWLTSIRYLELNISLLIILGVAGDDLLHLRLSFARQVEQVVAPVGGGRLVHRAPDQRWRLGSK